MRRRSTGAESNRRQATSGSRWQMFLTTMLSHLLGGAATQDAGVGTVQPVGTYGQGIDSWGVQDLVGNVWEWTSSKASLYKGNPAQLPVQHKDWIVIRGGCYASPTKGDLPVSGTLRNWVAPNYKNPVLGFRLIRPSS